MARYAKDPYWTTARFLSRCENCGATIHKGDSIFYYPLARSVFSGACAKAASRDFTALSADEDAYTSYGGGY